MEITAPTPAVPHRAAAPPRPLRILDITDFWSDEASGGVKTYLQAKMAWLAEAGIVHSVVVPGEETTDYRVGATRFHRIRGPRVPLSTGYRTLLSTTAVQRILMREQPDVIEVGSPFFVPWLVQRSMGRPPIPTLGFYHADVVRTFAEPYVHSRFLAALRVPLRMTARRFVRDVYRTFDLTVAASPSVVQELRTLGVRRVHHVSLGVDLDTFRPREPGERATREELGVPPGAPLGIFVGRLAREKRLDVVLDGHARIPEERRPHLLLVGDGPERPALEERTRRQSGLTLLGYRESREEVARIYGAADFYLACGPGETFGLSIVEALASGLAVVCVDRGAAPDRVAGADVSEHYAHGDRDGAARALEAVCDRLGDDLRDRARRHAEAHYDWNRTFDTLTGLYEGLATRRA